MRRRFLQGLLLLASIGHWPPLLAQTVRGRVTDRGTGAAVADARVLLVTEQRLAIAEFTSNDSGGFQLVAPAPGRYRLQFERPGFRLLITPPFDLQAGETVDYALQVNPLPPFALDTAIVEGQVVPRRMLGFYQRRAGGVGEFVTRQELERWNPRVFTDIVRHVPTFTLEIPPPIDPFREYRIVSRRAMQGFGVGCPPLVYLDDARLGSADVVDLDDVFAVGAIEAMEY